MDFTKTEFTNLREDIKKALAGVEKKYNLDFEFGSITYGAYNFRMKMSATKTDVGDARRLDFEQKCYEYGFEPEDYGKKVIFDGVEYAFVGFRENARKYCCWIERVSDGKMAAVAPQYLKTTLKRVC